MIGEYADRKQPSNVDVGNENTNWKTSRDEQRNVHKVPSTSKTMPSNFGAWLSDFRSGSNAANRRGSLMIVKDRVVDLEMSN